MKSGLGDWWPDLTMLCSCIYCCTAVTCMLEFLFLPCHRHALKKTFAFILFLPALSVSWIPSSNQHFIFSRAPIRSYELNFSHGIINTRSRCSLYGSNKCRILLQAFVKMQYIAQTPKLFGKPRFNYFVWLCGRKFDVI